MKKYCYQLIILGKDFGIKNEIIEIFQRRVEDLGIDWSSFIIIDNENCEGYTDSSPAFCIYLGAKTDDNNFTDSDFLTQVTKDASLLLPVVQGTLDNFGDCIPEILNNYNGINLSEEDRNQKIEQIVNNILEGFSLLKKNRKIFISYKRNESTNVAIQLYENLEKHGFDVFLDTHSIRKSEPFQDELWHQMADSEIVIILNTSDFLGSYWTQQELATASQLLLGIVIISWPENSDVIAKHAQISYPLKVQNSDFENSYIHSTLKEKPLSKIIESVESIRARTLASRRDNLISNFMKMAEEEGYQAYLDSYKIISMVKNDKDIIVIPAVGIPKSLNYELSSSFVEEIKKKKFENIFILYDATCVRDFWLRHLKWLDSSLVIKSLNILEVPTWINN
ncbi:TIR domain-containing protein [Psychrobacter namhaensis]|uniref:TIR domain-containing protein n=1 Tax=Psychrobacter namhaensis TaxID=292734 RepID=UPI001865E462|nr:TIR domain-containing protein [Psychrobacter namhaensis]